MNASQLAADAVRADAWTIVERLLESNANFARDAVVDGNTLLHVAAFFGAANSAAVLLLHGADPSQVNAAGQTAVDLAFLNGHDGLVAKLAVLGNAPEGTSIAAHTDASEMLSGIVATDVVSFGALPHDAFVRILSLLDVHSVLACGRVCRKLAKALDDSWLWEMLCWHHWRCDSLQARRGLCTWKDVYKEQHICHRAQQRHRERREVQSLAAQLSAAAGASDSPKRQLRAGEDLFSTPKMVPTMATSIEELFEPLAPL